MERLTGVLGLLVFLGLAFAFSTNRRAIRWRTVIIGLILQFVFAIFVLRVPFGQRIIQAGGDGAKSLLSYAFAGSSFVFGELGQQGGKYGFFIAFQVLPVIIFIAAFFAILYHYGVMQFIIRIIARVMMRFMGASGAESLNVAASIFMGQTEAPLTIRPFLPNLTQSELMVVMTSGMAHVSGAIMGAYFLVGIEPKHVLAAVIMTAPGTFVIAKMLVPETEKPLTAGRLEPTTEDELTGEEKHANVLGAAAKGTTDGLWLALNVAAMLISFLALIALINGVLGGTHNFFAHHGWSHFPDKLESILGVVFAPFAWLVGIPGHDCMKVGNLLGTRMVLNELVAFTLLGQQRAMLDPRSFTIATFALCGFANLGSIGIQIGGLGALAPNRRNDLARLGFRAMLAGTMANMMSAAIVGILLYA
ncbi:MAG TPA: nucleoside transporter C-terminal domain-containing protein [Candidatus Koribacter sp.]|jgi:CNT family concentrative nucleoside transporter